MEQAPGENYTELTITLLLNASKMKQKNRPDL